MKKYFINLFVTAVFIAYQIPFLQAQENNTITVGVIKGDIKGKDNVAIQAAIDMMAQRGGGTVNVLPGEYILNDAIRLRSNIRLIGDRQKTILKHAPSVSSYLSKDADIGQKEITPKDASLFKVGMGVVCRSKTLSNKMVTRPSTITRIEKGVLYIKDYLDFDFIADSGTQGKGEALVANIFPIIYGFGIENAFVDGFTVDSKVDDNPGWVDVRTGGVVLERTDNCTIRNITSINARGDGILLVTAEHTVIEDCETYNNTYHGIHPGSHSAWTKVRRNIMHHNGSDGLYICWGIKESEFTDNVIYRNGTRDFSDVRHLGKRNGISIGHKDTDCLIARNHIYENAVAGIYVRTKTEANGAHRNKFTDNTIENNGLAGQVTNGSGVHICGVTHDLLFENNIIRETRQGNDRLQKNAFVIESGVTRTKIANNKISGHSGEAIVDKAKSPDNQLQDVKNN